MSIASIQKILKPTKYRAIDTSGNNNHGHIYSGRALEFDGVSDYFQHNGGTAIDGVNKFNDNVPWTFASWMYINDDGLTFFVGNDASTTPHIGQMNSDELAFRAEGGQYFRWTSDKLEFGVWHRIVFVATGVDSTVHCYLNGSELGTAINKDTKSMSSADKVDQLVVSSGTATVHMDRSHALTTGDSVKIDMDSNDTYDEESVVITVVDSDTFTYTTAKSDITIGSIDGTDIGTVYFDFEAEGGSKMEFSGWGIPYQTGGARGHGLDGMMSDAQVWDAAWTQSDVTFDYLNPESLALNNSGTSLTESNLKIWYPMQDGHRGQQSYILDGANTGLSDNMYPNLDFTSGFGSDTITSTAATSFVTSGSGGKYTNTSATNQVVGTTYKVTLNAQTTASAGFEIRDAGTTNIYMQHISTDVYNDTFYYTATHAQLFFKNRNAGTFTLNSISVQPVNDKHHATTVFYGDEILADGGFESGIDSWGNEDATLTSSSDYKHGGSTSLKIVQAGTSYDLAYKSFTTVVGRTYKLDMWLYKHAEGAGAVTWGVGTSTSGVENVANTAMSTYTEWTQIPATTFVATATTTYVHVLPHNGASSADTCYVDDISIKEVGVASGWTDADQQLDIPQTALQSYNQLAWAPHDHTDGFFVQNLDLASNTLMNLTEGSMSWWTFIDRADRGMAFWQIFDNADSTDDYLRSYLDTNGYIDLVQENQDAGGAAEFNYKYDLNSFGWGSAGYLGKWIHFVWSNDNTGADAKLYINGEAVTVTVVSEAGQDGWTNFATDSSTNRIKLLSGSWGDGVGAMTEVSFWNKQLSQAEVNELYNGGIALDATTHSAYNATYGSSALKGYWRDNGLADWPDLSGGGNDLAANNPEEGDTMLLPAGVDASRDTQGFLMNRQKDTNSLNLYDTGTSDNQFDDKSYVKLNNNPIDADAFTSYNKPISASLWVKHKRTQDAGMHGLLWLADADSKIFAIGIEGGYDVEVLYETNQDSLALLSRPTVTQFDDGRASAGTVVPEDEWTHIAVCCVSGKHTAADDSAGDVMTDSGASFVVDDLINGWIHNFEGAGSPGGADDSFGAITDNTATTITTTLSGGADNSFDTDDRYHAVKVYVNGEAVKVDSNNDSGTPAGADADPSYFVGVDDATNRQCGLEVDDVCVYNDKWLTQAEVTRIYKAGKRSHK